MSGRHESLQAGDGVPLALEVHGDAGPVVLLLHGISSHAGWYRELAGEMAARGLVVGLADRRGSGRSGGPRGHAPSWRTLADDAAGLARALAHRQGVQRVHLVGISLGGVLALACALTRPELFGRLALLTPALASSLKVPLADRLRLFGRSLTRPRDLHDLPITPDMLTGCPRWQAALGRDPLRISKASARFLTSFLRMQRFVLRRATRLRHDVLALLAGADAIVDNDAVLCTLLRMRRARVRVEFFEEAEHALAASVPSSELARALVRWMDQGPAGLERGQHVLRTVHGRGDPCPPPELDGRHPA